MDLVHLTKSYHKLLYLSVKSHISANSFSGRYMQVAGIIKCNDRSWLCIEFNAHTIVAQCWIRAREGILAAVFIFEQVASTEEEKESTKNKHKRCQVQCVGKTSEKSVIIFAIFSKGSWYLHE